MYVTHHGNKFCTVVKSYDKNSHSNKTFKLQLNTVIFYDDHENKRYPPDQNRSL